MPFDLNQQKLKHLHAFIREDEKAIDLDNKRITFVVSSEVIDRHDEVVESRAVYEAIRRKGEFADNPICLACHLHRLENGMPPAVGSWDVSTARLVNVGDHEQVEMTLQFDTELQLGAEHWIAYKNRTMRAVSIGFRVLEYRLDKSGEKTLYVITKLELLEISCVAVGANPEALARLKGFEWAARKSPDIQDFVKHYLDQEVRSLRDWLDEKFQTLEDLLYFHNQKQSADLFSAAEELSPGTSSDPRKADGSSGDFAALKKAIESLLKKG
ncbi:MAG TPA: HK97 family phage prohead protease [Anaerohalosphaeraceae bacterium]|nr:HK97 family phage prohead protease [Anaerohalosphaeraceae bacterium]HQG06864.1 HK97 family phage prohead protease [Anaerohalosphaeraceae bacterium]HQI08443.1 HK97 family phage prohead protease [Anaerohalosphaeraceae bacterium]HQJ68762.1 HK97 family phage prohead protease [Anaerohalosphaeraceae bacterium]